MRISSRLTLGLIGQVCMLGLITFALFFLNIKLKQVNTFTVTRVTQIRAVNNFTLQVKDYLSDKYTYNDSTAPFQP
jgi:CHASE3 domain sensor protein